MSKRYSQAKRVVASVEWRRMAAMAMFYRVYKQHEGQRSHFTVMHYNFHCCHLAPFAASADPCAIRATHMVSDRDTKHE